MQNLWQSFLDWMYAPRQVLALCEIWPRVRELFSFPGLKRMDVLLLVIFELFGVVLFDLPRTPRGPELDLTGYSLVLEDNFDGDTLNLDIWEYRGTGMSSSGRRFHPAQVRVENGNLILRAEYREDGPAGADWYNAMLRTKQEFTYGYFEATCIAADLGGSAWWLNAQGMTSSALSQGGVGGAELDIMEAYNNNNLLKKNSVGINVHVDGYGADLKSQQLGNWRGKNIYKQINTYGLLWTQEEYIFYVNGVEAVRSSFKDGVSNAPEYAIFSMALPLEIIQGTDRSLATEFIIDSVRIWQKDG